MNKKLFIPSILFLAIMMSFSFSNKASASTPILSLSGTGDGDSVQLSITGDSSTSVWLHYFKSGYGQQISLIGTTNSSGNLTTTISSSGYGMTPNSTVYVTLSGINGVQSQNVSWPTTSSLISSSNMLSLSQTGLVLSIGQSSTITASNLNSSSLYLSNNSNPMIANVSLSGSQVTIFANSYGSTVATVCLLNNNSNCSSVYVTVQNSNAQPLTFSQNSISMYSGQSVSIQIIGGSGSYLVLNNSSQNNGTVQTSISGSTLTLSTTSTGGSSSIIVCSTDNSSCGIVNITIGSVSPNSVSFSQSSPTVSVGQNLNVSIYGPSGSLFYVSSNSNPGIVQANLSGNTLTLLGIANGSSTISICASASNCGSLTVTVNSNSSSSGGFPILSQDNVSLLVGQNLNITISGGSMPYRILFNSNNIFQPTLNVNVLTISGIGIGSGSMNVCSFYNNCDTITITIKDSTASTLPVGCLSTLGYSQTTGLPCSGISSVAASVPIDCTGALYSVSTGQVCPSNTVTSITQPSVFVSTPTPSIVTIFKFTKSLKLGSKGTEVLELQKKLKTLGFYTGRIDGGFGSSTEKAVKALQKAHKLPQIGNVGPNTRALLNK